MRYGALFRFSHCHLLQKLTVELVFTTQEKREVGRDSPDPLVLKWSGANLPITHFPFQGGRVVVFQVRNTEPVNVKTLGSLLGIFILCQFDKNYDVK
jgi:hypothetical protein